MHELAIADAMVSMLVEQANGHRVSRVGMRIGHLRQVVPASLQFSFELVTKDTLLDGAALEIESVPTTVWCARCDLESHPDAFPLVCARCWTTDVQVTKGEEMLVDWIETEE